MASKSESLPELFDVVKAKFPASLEPDRWYLVAVSKTRPPLTVRLLIPQASALVTCSDPFQFGQLYTYLTKQQEYSSPDRRRFLNKRLREFVMKQWVTIGVPKAATALFGLIKEEQPGDVDLTFTKYVMADTPFHVLLWLAALKPPPIPLASPGLQVERFLSVNTVTTQSPLADGKAAKKPVK